MKKTLLAFAIMAATGSASATEIYNTDTSKLSFKGEIDLYLGANEIDDIKSDADISYWAKVQFDMEQKISESITAFGSFEIEGDAGYLDLDDVYAGFKMDTWAVAAGEVGDFGDSADAINKDDISNEGNYASATSHQLESKGKGLSFKGEFVEGLTLIADVHTQSDEEIDNTYGVSADYEFANFSVGASYIMGEAAAEVDYSVAGVSVAAQFDALYLTAVYSMYEGIDSFSFWDTADYNSGTAIGVAAAYQLDKARLYTTYSLTTSDENTATGDSYAEDLEVSNLLVGIDYALVDNITLFAEYQIGDYDDGATSTDAYTALAGVYYAF